MERYTQIYRLTTNSDANLICYHPLLSKPPHPFSLVHLLFQIFILLAASNLRRSDLRINLLLSEKCVRQRLHECRSKRRLHRLVRDRRHSRDEPVVLQRPTFKSSKRRKEFLAILLCQRF